MSRFLVVFIVGSLLAVGSVIVWSKNNSSPAKAPDTTQSIFNFNLPNSNQNQSQNTQQQQAQQQTQQQVTNLITEDIKLGTGSAVKDGDTISVHYIGTLLNGQKFDSSVDRGEPFSFRVGDGQVIAGWEQGILGMKTGGRRRLVIPADLAYGSQAVGPIPANSPLIFEIELLEIK